MSREDLHTNRIQSSASSAVPSSGPAYFALNLRSELPSYVTLNLRYNQPLPPSLQGKVAKRSFTRRRVCCGLLELILLCPAILCFCGVVLLPSAVYFIPGELFPTLSNGSLSLNESIMNEDGDCSQGFFRDLDATDDSCRPSCEELSVDSAYSMGGFSLYQIVVMAAGALSSASALCFLGLSLILKTTTSFPRVYSLYEILTAAAIGILFLIGGVRNDFFCVTDHLKISGEETIFCKVFGVLFSYLCIQLTMLSAFQSASLLWMAVFPRSYKLSKRAGHLKFLHFVSIIMCVVVPIITSLLQLADGFETIGVPPLLCLGRNKDYVYYMFSLPMSVIGVIPSATVVIAGWILLKSCCKKTPSYDAVKLKMLGIIFYIVLIILAVTSCLVYHLVYRDVMSQEISNYSACESDGFQDCPISRLATHVVIFQRLLVASVVTLMLLPLVILLCSIELSGCCRRKCCKQCCTRQKSVSGSHCSVHSFTEIL